MRIAELYQSRQGEGLLTGTESIFIRTSGCNLRCWFCDTPYTSWAPEGVEMDVAGVLDGASQWSATRHVVITGGEPMLQLDEALIDALHQRGFRIAVESNGTLPATPGIDWLCISPKAGTNVVQQSGDELKLVWPQKGIDPAELEGWDFGHFLIQPMDCEDGKAAVDAAIRLAMERPRWRLSLQAHKVVGLA